MAKTGVPARTDAIDVTDPGAAKALAAAWQGIEQFFGGQVAEWRVLPGTDDEPDGVINALGFSIEATHEVSPETLVADLGGRDRRLSFLPFYNYLNGMHSPEFSDPQEMTNWGTLYLKGSVESGTSKVPAYARNAITAYKTAHGIETRRGPRRRVVRLDAINSIDPKEIPADQVDALLALAARISGSGNKTTSEVSASS